MATVSESLEAIFSVNDRPFSQGVDRMVSKLDRLGQKSEQASNQQERSFGRARDSLGRFVSSGTSAGSALEKAFNAPLNGITKWVGGFFAADRALALLKQGFQIVSDIERADSALQAVTDSSIDFARSQSFLRALSDQLGISYVTLASSYKGLAAATRGTILEGKETERIFTSVVHAGAALKLSNDEIQGALLALSQMMSKGTVSAEELRGQLGERLPGAFKLMAEALGVTEPQLNKMLEQGQIMAQDALPKLAEQLEKTYGSKAQNNINTMAGGFTRMKDQLSLFLAEFTKTNGIDRFFTKLSNGFANYVTGLREAQKRGESIVLLSGDRRKELTLQAQQRQEFSTATPERRAEMQDQLRRDLTNARFRSRNPLLNEAVRNANARYAEQIEERILNLKREGLKVYVRERQEAEKAEKVKMAATKPKAFDIDQAKTRRDALEKQIQNLVGGNKSVPAALQAEYNKLTTQIDRAENATKKHKGETQRFVTVVDNLKLAEKLVLDEIAKKRSLGLTIDPKTFHELDLIRTQIKRVSGEIEKPISLAIRQDSFQNQYYKGSSERQARLRSALGDRRNEPNQYGTLDFYTSQVEKIQIVLNKVNAGRLKMPDGTLEELADYLGKIEKINKETEKQKAAASEKAENDRLSKLPVIGSFGPIQIINDSVDKMESVLRNLKDMISDSLKQAAVAAFVGMGEVIGGLIAGSAGIEAVPAMLLNTLGGLMKQLGQIAIQAAIGLQAIQTALKTLNPAVALVAGIGLIALGSAIQSGVSKLGSGGARKMAKGGTLTGRTFIEAGEYPGANNRPEFVSPVDVGAKLIAEHMVKMGGFGDSGGVIELRMAGTEMRGTIRRVERSLQTIG